MSWDHPTDCQKAAGRMKSYRQRPTVLQEDLMKAPALILSRVATPHTNGFGSQARPLSPCAKSTDTTASDSCGAAPAARSAWNDAAPRCATPRSPRQLQRPLSSIWTKDAGCVPPLAWPRAPKPRWRNCSAWLDTTPSGAMPRIHGVYSSIALAKVTLHIDSRQANTNISNGCGGTGYLDQVRHLLAEALPAFAASRRGDLLTEAYLLQGACLLRQTVSDPVQAASNRPGPGHDAPP